MTIKASHVDKNHQININKKVSKKTILPQQCIWKKREFSEKLGNFGENYNVIDDDECNFTIWQWEHLTKGRYLWTCYLLYIILPISYVVMAAL